MANQAPIPTPGKRLTDLSTAERDKQITRNMYNPEDGYSATHPNAIANGDARGKGNSKYLSVFDLQYKNSS